MAGSDDWGMQQPRVAVLCGELQSVIARLRQDLAQLAAQAQGHAQSSGGGNNGGRSKHEDRVFCLRAPGLVLAAPSAGEARREAQGLTAACCNAREKLRMLASAGSLSEGVNRVDSGEVLRPLLECARSGATTARATSEALAAVHRIVAELGAFERPDGDGRVGRTLRMVVEATGECVFRVTETGEDEIAVMWALEVLEACVSCGAAKDALTDQEFEKVFVTIFENAVAGSNADMLRRLSTRKLSVLVGNLFTRLYLGRSPETESVAGKDFAFRLFAFLCKRIDPDASRWHDDNESRRTCLDLVLTAIVATINPDSGDIMMCEDAVVRDLICDELFRSALQICQASCRPSNIAFESNDQDALQVVALPPQKQSSGTAKSSSKKGKVEKQNNKRRTSSDISDAGDMIHEKASGTSSSPPSRGFRDPYAKIPSSFRGLEKQYEAEAVELYGSVRNAAGIGRISSGVLTRALRIAHVLMAHANTRRYLRVQIEAFCGSVFLRTLESKSKMGESEARRLIFETLTDLFADPTFPIDLFCNFDCDMNSNNVLENLFVFLSNHSFPKQLRRLPLDSLQLVSLRCIQLGIKSIAIRKHMDFGDVKASEDLLALLDSPDELQRRKVRKRVLHECVTEFNRKPKAGIEALVAAEFLGNPPSSKEIANFLRNSKELDKTKIGEFLGGTGDINIATLGSFVDTFEIHDMELLAALRMFLETFRLPGEAQMIDRILQSFAERAHLECFDAKRFPTVDCCYLLCFSIILLNTDLHNPNIRPEKKMSFESFVVNNRNYGEEVSKGQDMPMELLKKIYDEIKGREINTMSDTLLTAEVTTDRWTDMMLRPNEDMKLVKTVQGTNAFERYDKLLFLEIHRPAFAALSVVYHAGDPNRQPRAVELALEGIMNCAEIASRFNLVKVLDRITVDVCKFTSLIRYAQSAMEPSIHSPSDKSAGTIDEETDTDLEEEADGHEDEKSSVGSTLVSSNNFRKDSSRDILGSSNSILGALRILSKSVKAQNATTSMFQIMKRHANSLRLAWPYIVYCLLRLSDLDMIPEGLLQETKDPFLDSTLRVKFHRVCATACLKDAESRASHARSQFERSKGWVSWLSGESRSEAEEQVKAKEEELFSTRKAVKLAALSLESKEVGSLPADSNSADDSEKAQLRMRIDASTISRFPSETSKLPETTFVALVRGIIVSCCGDDAHCPTEETLMKDITSVDTMDSESDGDLRGDIRLDMLSPPSRASRLFGLHLLMEISVTNISRIELVWGMVKSHFMQELQTAKQANCHAEKAAVGLLRIALRLIWTNSEDVTNLFRFLLELPSDVLPGFDLLLCDSFLALLADAPKDEPLWNDTIFKTLIVISQSENFRVALQGLQILSKIFAQPRLREAPVHDLLHVHRAFVTRSLLHRKWILVSQPAKDKADESMDLIMDLLNLLFILHSRLMEGIEHRSESWFAEELQVLRFFSDVVIAKTPTAANSNGEDAEVNFLNLPSLREHAAKLMSSAVKEVLEANALKGEQWKQVVESVLRLPRDESPIVGTLRSKLAALKLEILDQEFKVIDTLLEDEMDQVCVMVAHDVLNIPQADRDGFVAILDRKPGLLERIEKKLNTSLRKERESSPAVENGNQKDDGNNKKAEEQAKEEESLRQ